MHKVHPSRLFCAKRTDVVMQCDWLNLPVVVAAGSLVVGPARHSCGKGGVSHKRRPGTCGTL